MFPRDSHIWVELAIILKTSISLLLGGTLGWERELSHKSAGLRTHMLIAGSSCALTLLALDLLEKFSTQTAGVVQSDPIRVIVAIVTGVAFIGAGTIIRTNSSASDVKGLTTAASLLLASAIGLATALENYIVAIGLTVLGVIVMRFFLRLEETIGSK